MIGAQAPAFSTAVEVEADQKIQMLAGQVEAVLAVLVVLVKMPLEAGMDQML